MELLQVASEIGPVIDLYRDMQPRRVLEIGCWDGGTLQLWLEEASPNVVVAVDLEHRNRDAYEAWRKPGTALHLYTASSLEMETIAQIHSHAPYDWVLVDGDHTEAGVRSDVGVCLPLISPGGILLIHDIQPAAGDESYPPKTVLDELEALGHPVERHIDPKPETWTHGMGVVRL